MVVLDCLYYDDFGGMVDISGGRVIIGVYGEDNILLIGDLENVDFIKIGVVYIFECSVDDEWMEV